MAATNQTSPYRAGLPRHLEAFDSVYVAVIDDHRRAIESVSKADPITEDLLIGQARILEQHQWFVRAHSESGSSPLPSEGGVR